MFNRLVKELNDFLKSYYINTNATDIFEETLLKLAGVETLPKQCQFKPLRIGENVICFSFKGIEEKDADQFLNFIKENGDPEASIEYIPPSKEAEDDFYMDDDLFDAYRFNTKLNMVCEKWIPMFKDEITNISQKSPEQLDRYKKQCENEKDIKENKLLDAITKQLNEIEEQDYEDFTKGKLHVIYNTLKDAIKHNNQDRNVNCGSGNELIWSCRLFLKVCNEIPSLKDSEILTELEENFLQYCKLTCTPLQLQMLNQMMPLVLPDLLRPPVQQPQPQPRASILGSIFNTFFGSRENTPTPNTTIEKPDDRYLCSEPNSDDESSDLSSDDFGFDTSIENSPTMRNR